jgi:hypothetical protein
MRNLILVAALACVPRLSAQIIPSERGSVSQTIDGTHITVEYARPRVRGRDGVFGKLEAWDRPWTPGADSATTLSVSKPARLLGREVPAGRYSVWLVPRARGPWTFVLDSRTALYHTARPDSTPEQIRALVTPRESAHTEALTWSFPVVTTTGTTLEMRWGAVAVDVPIEVTPTYALTVSAADAAPYLGEYDFAYTDPQNTEPPAILTIARRDDGRLFGQWRASTGSLREWQLLPAGTDSLVQGNLFQGELWSVAYWARVVFQRGDGGRITGFEIRSNGNVVARGARKQR